MMIQYLSLCLFMGFLVGILIGSIIYVILKFPPLFLFMGILVALFTIGILYVILKWLFEHIIFENEERED